MAVKRFMGVNPCALMLSPLVAKPKVVVMTTNTEAKDKTTKPIAKGEFNTSEYSAANRMGNALGIYSSLV